MSGAAVLASVALSLLATMACGGSSQAASVTIGDAAFRVEVLTTPEQRTRGLSGRDRLEPESGALFVYQPGGAGSIWMKGMLFDLDLVWIGEDCTVVHITEKVPQPEPGTPDARLPRYRPSVPASYTIEINAGDVERSGIRAGDEVRFSGFTVQGPGR